MVFPLWEVDISSHNGVSEQPTGIILGNESLAAARLFSHSSSYKTEMPSASLSSRHKTAGKMITVLLITTFIVKRANKYSEVKLWCKIFLNTSCISL